MWYFRTGDFGSTFPFLTFIICISPFSSLHGTWLKQVAWNTIEDCIITVSLWNSLKMTAFNLQALLYSNPFSISFLSMCMTISWQNPFHSQDTCCPGMDQSQECSVPWGTKYHLGDLHCPHIIHMHSLMDMADRQNKLTVTLLTQQILTN